MHTAVEGRREENKRGAGDGPSQQLPHHTSVLFPLFFRCRQTQGFQKETAGKGLWMSLEKGRALPLFSATILEKQEPKKAWPGRDPCAPWHLEMKKCVGGHLPIEEARNHFLEKSQEMPQFWRGRMQCQTQAS